MPEGFCNFRATDRIVIQFDLPAGWSGAGLAWKHFVSGICGLNFSRTLELCSPKRGDHSSIYPNGWQFSFAPARPPVNNQLV
jgi:hypothetical protein